MKSKQLISKYLNTEKQNFESSVCKRVKVAQVDLLAHLSSGEHSGHWASCFKF